MAGSTASSDGFSDFLDAYRILLDFQKWTYDTYQRDARLFLTIEVVALGLVASFVADGRVDSWSTVFMICVAVTAGMFLTVAWASRQRREYFMAKSRLEKLREMELQLPELFRYFSTGYNEAREQSESVYFLPALGEWVPCLPHVYRRSAFLKSLVLQQVFLFLWIVILAAVLVQAGGY